jgi:hypothetical protein
MAVLCVIALSRNTAKYPDRTPQKITNYLLMITWIISLQIPKTNESLNFHNATSTMATLTPTTINSNFLQALVAFPPWRKPSFLLQYPISESQTQAQGQGSGAI